MFLHILFTIPYLPIASTNFISHKYKSGAQGSMPNIFRYISVYIPLFRQYFMTLFFVVERIFLPCNHKSKGHVYWMHSIHLSLECLHYFLRHIYERDLSQQGINVILLQNHFKKYISSILRVDHLHTGSFCACKFRKKKHQLQLTEKIKKENQEIAYTIHIAEKKC